ncbi:MAG: dephospho-CoA kinase [Pseudomonadota bacterium]
MIRLGLTGSIGMGKSTTAKMFADEGVRVWDADAAVHRLYAAGGGGAAALRGIAPSAVGTDDAVDRDALRRAIATDPDLLKKLEAVIHPLVAADRAAFLQDAETSGQAVALLDIPLLYEIGAEKDLDAVVVVTAPESAQRARVLDRGTMTERQLDAIVERQVPDAEKRSRADYVIDTSRGFDHARERVREILEEVLDA